MLVLCSASEPSVGAGVSSFAGDTSLAELLVLARWLCQDVSCRGWRGRDVRVACPRRRPLRRQPWGTRVLLTPEEFEVFIRKLLEKIREVAPNVHLGLD